MATPFMGLILPTPGVTNDLTGEQMYITAWGVVDGHDHSSGKGTPVRAAGLSIDADLPFNLITTTGVNATGLRSVRFVSQASTLSLLADINSVYFSGGNFYVNNGSGQAIQITSGATLSAASLGGISGLAAPASAAFGSATFTWRSGTNIAATMDCGPLLIRDTGVSANGITIITPPGIAAYSITLPTALPSVNALLSMSTAGALSAFGALTGNDLTLAGNLKLSLAAQAVISVTSANAQLQLLGNKTATDTGTDILTNTTATRTAGNLFQVNNNGTAKLNVDFQGLLTLGSQAGPLQSASLYTAITPNANWTASNGLAYWKDANGLVRIKGSVSLGAGGVNPMFTLPAGFRPAFTRSFMVVNDTTTSAIEFQVASSGAMSVVGGAAGQLYFLDCIAFSAEA